MCVWPKSARVHYSHPSSASARSTHLASFTRHHAHSPVVSIHPLRLPNHHVVADRPPRVAAPPRQPRGPGAGLRRFQQRRRAHGRGRPHVAQPLRRLRRRGGRAGPRARARGAARVVRRPAPRTRVDFLLLVDDLVVRDCGRRDAPLPRLRRAAAEGVACRAGPGAGRRARGRRPAARPRDILLLPPSKLICRVVCGRGARLRAVRGGVRGALGRVPGPVVPRGRLGAADGRAARRGA
jgi:hypothetical protein